MSDEFDNDELANASGSELRKKLEQALKENRALKTDVVSLRAEKLISDKGYSLLKPEDLAGVDPKDLESRAETLHKERQDGQVDVVRQALRRKGLDGEELEKAVTDLLGEDGDNDDGLDRVRAVSGLKGKTTKLVNPENLHDEDLLKHAFGVD